MDSYAIASAIATRFSAENVTPPSGQEDPKLVTADLPDGITVFPTILVMPPVMENGRVMHGPIRDLDLVYQVVLYLSRADGTPRRAKAIHDWATALYGQLAGQIMLGLSTYVRLAWLRSFRAGVVSYGAEEYDGVAFEVVVHVSESYAPAA
jgi:hypothetical protein